MQEAKVGRVFDERKNLVRRDIVRRYSVFKWDLVEGLPQGPFLLRMVMEFFGVRADTDKFDTLESNGNVRRGLNLKNYDMMSVDRTLLNSNIDSWSKMYNEPVL